MRSPLQSPSKRAFLHLSPRQPDRKTPNKVPTKRSPLQSPSKRAFFRLSPRERERRTPIRLLRNDRISATGVTRPRVAAVKLDQRKTECIFCKKSFKSGPDYMRHITECVVIERPKFTLKFQNGDLTDNAFKHHTTVLAQIVDCSSMRPSGVSRVLADKYPFSDPYSARRRVGAFNWARREDRADPGTVGICKLEGRRGPFVVNMYAQFYRGKNIEENVANQNLLSQLRRASRNERQHGFVSDDHFIKGLERDTLENRILWFRECLGKLAQYVTRAWVQKIVFPYKIGENLSHEDWEKHYVPAIESFFDEVSRRKISVIVLNMN
ncbi:uncharacterized protein [Palaemon carinicauda]|uniref:uncharacterized protein n=1 Tax=Palaemon carinicauda TaxID=392227 RepID=UPI0035B64214